jgi:SAM-dependent methyltransferase
MNGEHREIRDLDWDREWQSAWKPHVNNAWFRYQDDVYTSWWRTRVAPPENGERRPRVLTTDAFAEACGLPALDGVLPSVRRVLMDVSPRILERAMRVCERGRIVPISCVTDVRCPGFRADVFDLVFSPSTLDHFSDAAEIAMALVELRRVLRPGGHLLIALDNPANPLLRVRQALYRRTGSLGGLIPFPMGQTLSRARLVRELEHAGFDVIESRYLVHTPRIVGLWLGELAARTRRDRVGRELRRLFNALERLFAALPSRRWTGHFVAVHCRRAAP